MENTQADFSQEFQDFPWYVFCSLKSNAKNKKL